MKLRKLTISTFRIATSASTSCALPPCMKSATRAALPVFSNWQSAARLRRKSAFSPPTTLLSEQELQELLRLALRSMLEDGKGACSYKNIIGGAVRAISEDDKRERILKAVAADLAEEDTARLLMLASFARNTWILVDELSEAAQARYWRDVLPDWIRYSDEETNEAVERLLKAGRPRAAFSCVRLHPGKSMRRCFSAFCRR